MGYAPVAYTIGYEGCKLEEFVARLQEQQIKVLIDIREKPASRKRGFSKTPLREALEEAGIEYVHVKALGSPSAIRYEYKNGGDKETFFTAYRAYLKTQLAYLRTVLDAVREKTCCLMCLERFVLLSYSSHLRVSRSRDRLCSCAVTVLISELSIMSSAGSS